MSIHNFAVSDRLVDVIVMSQNGSFSTALLELISNAHDAKATRIDVVLTAEKFEVKDNGVGFKDKDDILCKFQTLGDGIDVTDRDNIGTFHVGRSQILSHGIVKWRTANFAVNVDYRKFAGFELSETSTCLEQGCIVSGVLYERVTNYQLERTLADLKRNARFLRPDVYLNGILVNDRAIEWQHVDDKMSAKLDTADSGIHIYSNGVYVKTLSQYDWGFSGIINAKKLRLNIARNATADHDPVWIHVINYLRKEAKQRQKCKRTDRKANRRFLISSLKSMDTEMADQYCSEPLFTDVNGKHYSIVQLANSPAPLCGNLHSQTSHSAIAETATSTKQAIFLSQDTYEDWQCNDSVELKQELTRCAVKAIQGEPDQKLVESVKRIDVESLDKIIDLVDTDMVIYKTADLTSRENAIIGMLNAISSAIFYCQRRLGSTVNRSIRHVELCKKHGALAATNGVDKIFVDRNLARQCLNNRQDFFRLVFTMIHEYCHDSNLETHKHGKEFYSRFHELTSDTNVCDECYKSAFSYIRKNFGNHRQPKPQWMGIKNENLEAYLLCDKPLNKLERALLELLNIQVVRGGQRTLVNIPMKSMKTPSPRQLNQLIGETVVRTESQIKRYVEDLGLTKSDSLFYAESNQQRLNDIQDWISYANLDLPFDGFSFDLIDRKVYPRNSELLSGLVTLQNLVALFPNVKAFVTQHDTKIAAYGTHHAIKNGHQLTVHAKQDQFSLNRYTEVACKIETEDGLYAELKQDLQCLIANHHFKSRDKVIEYLLNPDFVKSLL